MKKPVVVAVSGGFDPIHIGHVRMFQEAKKLGDELVVILTDHVPGDSDRSVCRALRELKPDIFANGGDRKPDGDPVPEVDLCKELGIEMVYNLGVGGKVQSSSWLIKKAAETSPDTEK